MNTNVNVNVMQHCTVVTLGDFSEVEMRRFFEERVLRNVSGRDGHGIRGMVARKKLVFERLWEAFGGKMVHWEDYITEFGVFLSFSALSGFWRFCRTITDAIFPSLDR